MKQIVLFFLLSSLLISVAYTKNGTLSDSHRQGTPSPPIGRHFSPYTHLHKRERLERFDHQQTVPSSHRKNGTAKRPYNSFDRIHPFDKYRQHDSFLTRSKINRHRKAASAHFPDKISTDSIQTAWVAHDGFEYYSPDDDENTMIVDSSGNVYAAGVSNYRAFTIKYDSSGSELWHAIYSDPADDYSEINAITTDKSGNVYVAGESDYEDISGYDYLTIKYNASGVEQWVERYNGSASFDDVANSIAVDDSGNVYVTGVTTDTVGNLDFATLKYNSSGIQQWIAEYDDPAHGDDGGIIILLDHSNNVYVTGNAVDSTGTNYDYATIKYSSSGVQQWIVRYDDGSNANDFVNAMAMDSTGSVYITGNSYDPGQGGDIATVKYDSSGNQQWVGLYNGSGNDNDEGFAIALDDSGNILVSGETYTSNDNFDCITLKYDPSGAQQWAALYDNGFNDAAIGLATDDSGNVYVTGGSENAITDIDYVTMKYSAAGVQQWSERFAGAGNGDDAPSGIGIAHSGTIYVSGSSLNSNNSYDFTTIKYSTSGDQQWVSYYNGPQVDYAYPAALALDRSGNIYITGTSRGSTTGDDIQTVKYNNAGVKQWSREFNGADNLDDDATGLALDDSANVYITGYTISATTGENFITIKYNSSGIQLWAEEYSEPSGQDAYPSAIAVDDSGNAYVTGSARDSTYNENYTTVKYSTSGNLRWIAEYDGPDHEDDESNAIALDKSGNVVVTGYSYSLTTSDDDVTIMYNADGVQQWTARYDGNNDDDDAYGLAIDDSGNVFVTGESYASGSGYDYATIKYNALGTQQWVAIYNGPGNSYDFSYAIAVDDSSNVYVTGGSSSLTSEDYATIKYTSSGTQQWVAVYDGPAGNDDEATKIAVDSSHNVYVTGYSPGVGTKEDIATLKYNASGIEQWVQRYDGPSHGYDYGAALAIDNSNNVVVTGEAEFESGSECVTIKYSQPGSPTTSMYAYRQHWNLVSMPKQVNNPSRTAVFPSSTSSLFKYSGGYVTQESLQTGVGYWLKLPAADTISVIGLDVASDSISVVAGWNLVGSVASTINTAAITSNPPGMITSSFFGYDANYFTASTIQPGQAYWVKVNQSGKLFLSSSSSSSTTRRIKIISSTEQPPPPPVDAESGTNAQVPIAYALHQNYPNPFNPTSEINYAIKDAGHVTLKVYDVLGREIATLVNETKQPGYYSVSWDASAMPSGVYFYRLTAGTFTSTMKMILTK